MSSQSPKLIDQVRHVLRVNHDARRTEETYVNWINMSQEGAARLIKERRLNNLSLFKLQ